MPGLGLYAYYSTGSPFDPPTQNCSFVLTEKSFLDVMEGEQDDMVCILSRMFISVDSTFDCVIYIRYEGVET